MHTRPRTWAFDLDLRIAGPASRPTGRLATVQGRGRSTYWGRPTLRCISTLHPRLWFLVPTKPNAVGRVDPRSGAGHHGLGSGGPQAGRHPATLLDQALDQPLRSRKRNIIEWGRRVYCDL